MADVVHEEVKHSDGGPSGMGFFMGILLLVIVLLALIYWGIPALQNSTGT